MLDHILCIVLLINDFYFLLFIVLPRLENPARKRTVPRTSRDFMEAVFLPENFRTFSGNFRPFLDGKNRKGSEVTREKIRKFPGGNTASTQVYCSDRRNRLFSLFSGNGSYRSRLFSVGSGEFRQFPCSRIPEGSAKFRPGICWKSTEPMGTDRNSSEEIWIGILLQGNRRNSTEPIGSDVSSLIWASSSDFSFFPSGYGDFSRTSR